MVSEKSIESGMRADGMKKGSRGKRIRIRIFDTTLRDGEQTPRVSLDMEEKLTIARALDELGVDTIEAGFPISSAGEKMAVKRIAGAGLKAEICGLARADKRDVDAALSCDVDLVHIFIATSDIHLKNKLKMGREEVKERAISSIEYAKSHGVKVEFSCEDATRTDLDFLKEMCLGAQGAGADRINLPDTVGVSSTSKMFDLIKSMKKVTRVPLSVHCHDDLGLAVANSLAGVDAGARQVEATINGIGERAGNAALEEVVMGLELLLGLQTRINTQGLNKVSRLVSRLTGVQVPPNKAIVGENAFAHESGIHAHGVIEAPSTYEAMSPEIVGKSTEILIGKHTGRHALKSRFEALGFELDGPQLSSALEQIKSLVDASKHITDEDLIAIGWDIKGKVPDEKRRLSLDECTVLTGLNLTPTATIAVSLDGQTKRFSQVGVGPVDAAVNALKSIAEGITMEEYRLNAITGGANALCEVTVKLRADGPVAIGRSVKPDIVLASVEATVEALNRLFMAQEDR
jgi:isopropylmalate/citramalate/homocitrate synthase-like protein